MTKKQATRPLGISLGLGFAVCLAASPLANAQENPFGVVAVEAGPLAAAEGSCGGHGAEGGCGSKSNEDAGDEDAGDEDAGDEDAGDD
ncbi:MAG: hypothetical protein EXR83_09800 [Gammaproteobacteria bacterium]|nr:hypothetical protein [Gammaproteobacteria bacterium]